MDPDPAPAIFVIDLQDANKKLIKKKVFCLLLLEGTFASFFKDKKSKRSHYSVGFFLLFVLDDRINIQIRIHTSDLWIRIRIQEAQKHTDPMDPQHCFLCHNTI